MPVPVHRLVPLRRAPRAAVAALALTGVLATACSTGSPTPRPPVATSTSASPTVSPDATEVASAVDTLLGRRDAALVAGDTEAFAATLADPTAEAGRRQLTGFLAARALRVTRLAHDVLAPDVDPAAVDVTVRYRLSGTDRAERTARVRYVVARAGDGWRVASEGPVDGEAAPPWVAMPGLAVRRSAHAVVAGTARTSALEEAARTVDRAVPALRAAWPATPERVLVLVPDTVAEATALQGAGDGTGRVAATTDGPVGADGLATGDRVLLDPQARRRLTTSGRDVVLTHEVAHVAVRATVPGTAPTWLTEGYADHVGYARADVPTSALLAPLAAAVRDGSAPTALPTADSLDPAVGDIEVGYLAAWQAVELVAEQHGEAALRRLVRRCSVTGSQEAAERACDAAMPVVLGTDRDALTRQWQRRLAALAR